MEHMRMEPKHQFAAQYVLSRAAAERRERDILAAVSASAGGSGLLNLAPPSPAQSDSSSNGRLSSSAGSEAGVTVNKLSELLRSANNGHQAYGDERVAAIAAAAANMMAQPGEGANAVQVAAANLVTAMRQQLAREPPSQPPPETPPAPTEASLRIQQAEALLRSQAEALRLAVSQAAAAHNNENPSPLRHNGGYPSANDVSGQLSPELVEAFRLAQEQRLEQALRLHDPRMLGFSLPSPVQQAAVAAQAAQAQAQAAQAQAQAAQHVVQQQHHMHQAAQAVQAAQHAAQQAAQQAVHLQQNPQP